MDVYDRLGVKKRINGAGLVTRLGGSLMPPEVLEAMVEAAGAFVDIAELQARASAIIAEVTGAEAGLVTTGAAAALTLGTAACLTGLDAARMERLPDTAGMPHVVVVAPPHRNAYDPAIRAAGGPPPEGGLDDRAVGAGVPGAPPGGPPSSSSTWTWRPRRGVRRRSSSRGTGSRESRITGSGAASRQERRRSSDSSSRSGASSPSISGRRPLWPRGAWRPSPPVSPGYPTSRPGVARR